MKARTSKLTRRTFLSRTTLFAAAAPAVLSAKANAPAQLKAAIIGHTGRGNYGHELDVVFNGRDNITVVAVADPDPRGRSRAAGRTGALRQYADYREMLEKEKPDLVSIAPRQTDQHHAMAVAALEGGAHLYMEKPITRDLAEADELLDLADRKGLKIAVAHQMRLAPTIVHLQRALDEGLIGELVQIRTFGKQDHRAGGEDLIVLGTHLFDFIRMFAGAPSFCTARVLWKGRDITRADSRAATEDIGPVAGDEVEAQFGFSNGTHATFTSRARLQSNFGHWGFELIGARATVRVLADAYPLVHLLEPGKWEAGGRTDQWRPLPGDPGRNSSAAERSFGPANRRVVDDWLAAIRENREPACSGRKGMEALEMVMAVYHAALTGKRIPLPLPERRHPLTQT
jgi:predicted dehydrogenase